ncbi:MAG: phosphoribosylanthranilate isomerase [Gemmatimonadota bacterium]|jgi:phosphoribosylanthranilate isomerase
MKVKICGLCRAEDAAQAVAAGASHVGVVLVPGSPRVQTLESAAAILASAGRAKRVGVFVDEGPDVVRRAGEALRLDVLQLHGVESPDVVADLAEAGPWLVWKAVRPRSAAELDEALRRYGPVADGLLVDGYSAAGAGGVGAAFPWEALEAVRSRVPAGLMLGVAGGLGPDTVGEAVRRLAPDLVDVSSGVEAELCRKDPAKVTAFVTAALAAASN